MTSGVILAKNSEDLIEKAINSLKKVTEEIIVVDTGSDDNTVDLAKKAGAKVVNEVGGGYSDWRNRGLAEAKEKWVMYLDTDEELSEALVAEIKQVVKTDVYTSYAIPRKNIILGRVMTHGGWWPDYVKRLYKKDSLVHWKGDLHEEPVARGQMGHLINPILHHKHDNLSDMVEKTNKWSEIEAALLFENKHPKMAWWRFFRIMLSEFWLRFVHERGFLDGTEGIIYACYQIWSRFVTYAKLWEMQRKQVYNDDY